MLTTKQLLSLFERESIELFPCALPSPYLGLYMRDEVMARPMVVYAPHLEQPAKERLYRCVLAEELAHHWTISPHHLNGTAYTNAVCVGRLESVGRGLAADLLMPPIRTMKLLAMGRDVDELVFRFGVTHNMARFQRERLLHRKSDPHDTRLLERICAHSPALLERLGTRETANKGA